jgi:hypothetical protein
MLFMLFNQHCFKKRIYQSIRYMFSYIILIWFVYVFVYRLTVLIVFQSRRLLV